MTEKTIKILFRAKLEKGSIELEGEISKDTFDIVWPLLRDDGEGGRD